MRVDSLQPTNSIASKARLSSDPHTMEVVKKMACIAPLSLWTALNLLERFLKHVKGEITFTSTKDELDNIAWMTKWSLCVNYKNNY